MSARIYIAGAWVEQHQRARPMIAKVRAAGMIITCDWTVAEGDVCACTHHRQAHKPYAEGYEDVRRTIAPDVACFGPGCQCPGFNGIGSGGDSQLTAEARKKYALADLEGVLTADVFWLLAANDKGACGSWVELGAALAKRDAQPLGPGIVARRPFVVVSGPKNKRTIFTELADRLVDTDDEALEWIRLSFAPPVHEQASLTPAGDPPA